MEFGSKYAFVNQRAVLEEAEISPEVPVAEEADEPATGGAADRFKSVAPAAPASRRSELSERAAPPKAKKSVFGRPAGRGFAAARTDAEPTTNVCRVVVGSVGKSVSIATGDPTICGSCNSVLSSISKVEKSGDATYIWTCEYCGARNRDLTLAAEELPEALTSAADSANGVDYMLTPPSTSTGEERRGEEAGGEETIIFVCDTSGSMCISEPISDATARRLRGGRTGDLARLRQAGDDANQFLPGERRDVTYVSRMQALQAAVQHQIGELVKNRPNKRVGFVTFATDVTIIGDAAGDTRVLAGSRLNDFATLQAAGEGYKLTRGVKDSSEALVKKIYELSEEGQTALGPAVLVAVGMAAQHAGSKVVIVTDGMANIGCGSLEAPDLPAGATPEAKAAAAETARQAASTFFTRVANIASTAGVTVDVIGFEGANCNLEALSQLADATSGSMMRVNPANITEQFSNILEDEVVATNASVTMTSHAGLFIRDPAQDAIMEDAAPAPRVDTPATTVGMLRSKYAMQAGKVAGNVYDAPLPTIAEAESETPAACPPPRVPFVPTASSVTMYIGNVTSSSEVTFEYGQKHGSELPAALRKELSELKRIPFQVQISYTRPDGALCLRVITSALEITTEVRRAESNIQASPMVSHAARTTAAYAKGGRYQSSSVVAAQYQNLLARNVDGMDADSRDVYAAWNDETTVLRSALDAEVGKDRAMKRARATPAVSASVSSAMSAPASFARSIANSVSGLFRSSEAPKEERAPADPGALAPMAAPMAPAAAMPMVSEVAALGSADASEEEDDDDDRVARVTRRAGDDALAARIHGMGKGAKNYSKKSSY